MVLGIVGLAMSGCATTSDARYVYQDHDFGVVAIPRNTPQGREKYRQQAEVLMAQHFPQGYEIVRAEEVPAGTRTLTVGTSGTTEVAPQVTPHLLTVLKVGGSLTRTQADTLALRECRIIYKRADSPAKPFADAFAPEVALTPTCYHDPNTEVHKPAQDPPAKTNPETPRPPQPLVGE
jgi:hypothetical protein